ncbi:MAG: class I SAM-dependent methyltransferase [Patescibacteria group bacterium]
MFSSPEKNLKYLNLRENDIVVDLGAGVGFYALAAARMVPKGKVYAIEVQRDLLTSLKNKAKDFYLHNIETIVGDIEKDYGTKLADNLADVVIVSNVFFQIKAKSKFIKEIKRILKINGQVLFIDWSDNSFLVGSSTVASSPDIENFLNKNTVKEIFEKNNFLFERFVDAGLHHYGMILRKI